MKKLQGCIIGNNSSLPDNAIETAYKVGSLLASLGITLICGGKLGTMEAACKGARENDGLTVGIIPDSDFSGANKYCDIVIPTGIGYARNMTNVLAGDFVVAIGGGAGTLNEIAYAWQFKKNIYAFNNIDGWAKKMAGTKIDNKNEFEIKSISTIHE